MCIPLLFDTLAAGSLNPSLRIPRAVMPCAPCHVRFRSCALWCVDQGRNQAAVSATDERQVCFSVPTMLPSRCLFLCTVQLAWFDVNRARQSTSRNYAREVRAVSSPVTSTSSLSALPRPATAL